jgi:hypothetical protein
MMRELRNSAHRCEPEGLPSLFRLTKDFLEGATGSDVLRSCTNGAEGSSGWSVTIDHVGFIGPPCVDLVAVVDAANAAGFRLARQPFLSRLVSRELGSLRGVPEVPTMILLAYGAAREGRKVGVEIFFPQQEEEIVRSWIDRGVSEHVALEFSDLEGFRAAMRALEENGFRVPLFRQNDPVTRLPELGNRGRDLVTMYLDRPDGQRMTRIELCCLLDPTVNFSLSD